MLKFFSVAVRLSHATGVWLQHFDLAYYTGIGCLKHADTSQVSECLELESGLGLISKLCMLNNSIKDSPCYFLLAVISTKII